MLKFFKIITVVAIILLLTITVLISAFVYWTKDEQKQIPSNIVSKMEVAFEALSPNIDLYIGKAKAKFISFDKGFEIFLDESYFQFGSDVLVSAPKMIAEIKLRNLLLLDLELGDVKIFNPQFVISNEKGSRALDISSQNSLFSIYKNAIYELFSAIDKDSKVIPVEKVDLIGAKFSFNNKGEYETWDLKKASLKFFRLQNSNYLQTDLQTEIYGNLVDLVSKSRLMEGERLMIDVDFKNLPSKIVTAFVNDVDWLYGLDVNVSGKSVIVMNKNNSETSASLKTGFKFNKDELGDIELDYSGVLNLNPSKENKDIIIPTLKSEITLKNLEMKKMAAIWPNAYGGDIRDAVLKRVSKGIYKDVKITLDFGFENLEFNSVVSEKYSIVANIKDADVIFNTRYPTVKNVEGYFEFDGSNVLGEIKKANIKDTLNFSDTRIDVSNINSDISILEIKGSMEGDIMAVKHIVSAALKGKDKNYYYNSRPIKAFGSGEFYYKDDINDGFSYKHTDLKVEAISTDFEVQNVIKGINFKSDLASLKVDEYGIHIDSKGKLNSSPAEIKVWAGFIGSDNYTVNLKTVASDSDVNEIIPDYSMFIKGKTDIQFDYKSEGKKNSLIGKLNLSNAEIDFPYLSWKKSLGEFTEASFSGRNADFKALEIKNIQLTTNNSISTGKAIIALEDKSPNEVYFDKLNLGNNNTEIYYSSTNSFDRSGKKLGVNNIVKIEGEKFDASGIINGLGDDSNTGLKSSLTLDAKLGEVIMSKTARLKNFTAEVKCGFERCFSGNANGNFASGGSVAINFYQKLIDNEYQGVFKLTSDNAGKIFESLNLFDNVQKGFVTINSVTKYTNKPITNGDIFIKDYKIVKAPTLARIFSLASFSGIATLLSNSGVPMKKLSGAFSMRDGYVSIQDIRSFGDSLGLTSQGTYNIRSGVVDLSGAVTPSYSVNSFLGKIPILGNLFTAGEGEGLIAAKYSVSGKQPNINVSVNPLSALTPGFLRKIWGNSSTEIKIEDEANDKKTKYPARRNR